VLITVISLNDIWPNAAPLLDQNIFISNPKHRMRLHGEPAIDVRDSKYDVILFNLVPDVIANKWTARITDLTQTK